MGPRRTMRQVDVFSWLTTERGKAALRLEVLRQRRAESTHDYDAVDAALQAARQSARLETIDNLLSQLQES